MAPTGQMMMATAENPIGLSPDALDFMLGQIRDDLPRWIDENAEPFAPGASPRAIDWVARMILATSRRALLEFQEEILKCDLREACASIDLPVSILHGDCDASTPLPLTGERYLHQFPDAELVVYEGGTHGLMVTMPERLAGDIVGRVRAH